MRRIDALYCTRDTAEERTRSLIADIEERRRAASEEVSRAIAERVEALQERQRELLEQVDRVAKQKVEQLQQQVQAIQAGTCPPAPVEHPDKGGLPDPNVFILCEDATVSFKVGEEDFMEKIPDFGSITESSTYASRSYARGPALGMLKVGNPSYVWVFCCDRDGSRRSEGGDGVEVTFSKPKAFDQVSVEDTKDGKYRVSFIPLQEGTFSARITIAPPGLPPEDIQGAPFRLVARQPTEFHRIGAEDEPPKPRMGEQSEAASPLGTVSHPSGVDFDHSGRYLLAVDQGNHRLVVFDTQHPDGHTPVSAVGKKGLGPHDFDTPCDIVVDQENRVVVSDLLNHRLQVLEFEPRTQSLRFVRTVEGNLGFPKGVGLADGGLVLVCDSGNHCVKAFNMLEDFRLVREFGSQGIGEGQFTCPLDVAVNREGEILVSDTTSRISVFSKEGQFLRFLGAKGKKDGCFNYPASLTISDEDALYVCDQGNRRIQVLRASDGTFLHKWGGARKKAPEGEEPPPADDEEQEGVEKAPAEPVMAKPMGIAVNPHGLVVVADYECNLIWTF